ncbi:MAG TPA: PilX N-terminal domain-containing pilus assembly protein [Vicinamibacterales bacterium]|nr:PilX N-terminal domain-containing pilus assembly protein [Vicinamibacterales bacterium]
MTTNPCLCRSERGVALVIVLLLMAVLSGLATGFAMNGNVEATMARNEAYYAGARAAAEAGINRATSAVVLYNGNELLTGADGVANTADDGDLGLLGLVTGAAPYVLDANGQYSYSIEVLDDDDPSLYETALSADQLDAMCAGACVGSEDGTGSVDVNGRLILRATGWGPSNTVARLARVLNTTIANVDPSIIVDGDLDIGGNIRLEGLKGSVHANGDLTVNGNSADVSGDATASGQFTANDNFEAGGAQGGGYASINLPEIHADDYLPLADYILHDDGTATLADGSPCGAACSDWDWTPPAAGEPGNWALNDNDVEVGTFFVETSVTISGSPSGPGSNPVAVSIISKGSISITGSPRFAPENAENIMFVTDGDLMIGGNADLDTPAHVNGQIFVREQIHIAGNPEFEGRIIVTDDDNAFDDVTTNAIPGTPTITYDGGLGGFTTYTYNVSGWIEQ